MQAYLDFLNLEHTPPVTLEGLAQLTRAQVRGVPFESMTSIMRRASHPVGPVPPVDTDALLESWIQRRGGGVCFEVVATFGRMLSELGFQARAINAQIGWPGSHQALIVDLDQSQYLVDVGNGAPFLDPIPLDRASEVRYAGLAYRFRPDPASNDWIQDRWIDDAWVPFCRYDLRPADTTVREAAYQHHHTLGQSWVVDTLVLTRCDADEVWSLRDDELRHFTPDGKSVRRVAGPDEYARLAEDVFDVPAAPIDRARSLLAAR
ncbi:MAG: arylamine N-acetyltransferase [Chloroflexi bacterium]|nr:arylamine N-acetyltransferase [Chloroflexota bacterium]